MITDKNKKFLARFDHHLEDEHIEKLVNDEFRDVRWSIASHPNLKDDHIEKLINDVDSSVEDTARFHNPNYQGYLARKHGSPKE